MGKQCCSALVTSFGWAYRHYFVTLFLKIKFKFEHYKIEVCDVIDDIILHHSVRGGPKIMERGTRQTKDS